MAMLGQSIYLTWDAPSAGGWASNHQRSASRMTRCWVRMILMPRVFTGPNAQASIGAGPIGPRGRGPGARRVLEADRLSLSCGPVASIHRTRTLRVEPSARLSPTGIPTAFDGGISLIGK